MDDSTTVSILDGVAAALHELFADEVRMMFTMSAVCRTWRHRLLPMHPYMTCTDTAAALVGHGPADAPLAYRKRIVALMLDHGWLGALRCMTAETIDELCDGPDLLDWRVPELVMMVLAYHPDDGVASRVMESQRMNRTRLWSSSMHDLTAPTPTEAAEAAEDELASDGAVEGVYLGDKRPDAEQDHSDGVITRSLRHVPAISFRRAMILANAIEYDEDLLEEVDVRPYGWSRPIESAACHPKTVGDVIRTVWLALAYGCRIVPRSRPRHPNCVMLTYVIDELNINVGDDYRGVPDLGWLVLPDEVEARAGARVVTPHVIPRTGPWEAMRFERPGSHSETALNPWRSKSGW